MAAVTRLVTFADVDDDATDPMQLAVCVSHEAELTDGRRVVLLDDRGWSETQDWAGTSVADIEETARMVVGPDEPFEDRTQTDMEADHWTALQQVLRRHGVAIDASALSHVPHDIVLSERLRRR